MAEGLEIHLITIFPELFSSFLTSSLVHKAQERNLLKVTCHNIRDFASPPHFQVDDVPYGGGAGMVMKPEVLVRCVESVKHSAPHTHTVLMSASGTLFTQKKAAELSQKASLTLVCGRYEGVDQRAIEACIDEEISIGDYVVMGGEVPAMVVLEATLRLRAEVLGNALSLSEESFHDDPQLGRLLEGPQYTRPPEFQGRSVPEVLISGNHKRIAEWRRAQALERTKTRRPELLKPKDR